MATAKCMGLMKPSALQTSLETNEETAAANLTSEVQMHLLDGQC